MTSAWYMTILISTWLELVWKIQQNVITWSVPTWVINSYINLPDTIATDDILTWKVQWIGLNKFNIESRLWNAKAEKIQDIEDHTKTTVLNKENNISNPRLLYITARNYIHMQDAVNTCVKWKSTCKNVKTNALKISIPKTQRSHQDAVNRAKI